MDCDSKTYGLLRDILQFEKPADTEIEAIIEELKKTITILNQARLLNVLQSISDHFSKRVSHVYFEYS